MLQALLLIKIPVHDSLIMIHEYIPTLICIYPLLIDRAQSAWILTRARQASDSIINTAKEAFGDNDVDMDSLNLFKMMQDDDCVNDMTPSCSDIDANLMPPPSR